MYIYSANILTEYFKHAAHSQFFFLSSRCRLFHNAIFFGSCNIHILNTGCAKILKKIPAPKGLRVPLRCASGILQSVDHTWIQTFRDNILDPFSRVSQSKKNDLTLEDGSDRLSRNVGYQPTPRNVPEERRPHST